jgi:hypothetical protein
MTVTVGVTVTVTVHQKNDIWSQEVPRGPRRSQEVPKSDFGPKMNYVTVMNSILGPGPKMVPNCSQEVPSGPKRSQEGPKIGDAPKITPKITPKIAPKSTPKRTPNEVPNSKF